MSRPVNYLTVQTWIHFLSRARGRDRQPTLSLTRIDKGQDRVIEHCRCLRCCQAAEQIGNRHCSMPDARTTRPHGVPERLVFMQVCFGKLARRSMRTL